MESQDDASKKPQSKGCAGREAETTAESSGRKKAKVQREDDGKSEQKSPKVKLSKKNLLQLLGIMEGEVQVGVVRRNARNLHRKDGKRVRGRARLPAQAREDVIRLLRSEGGGPQELASRYGRALPADALRSLQRDDGVFARRRPPADVYEKPMAELERLEDKQRETYRRMLEQLLLAEKCHRRTVAELDSEKSKHADFMAKSDDFTNLLEQERERLKNLLEQEEARRARKDDRHGRRLGKLRAQLAELKSSALMLADERRLNGERLELRSQKVRELAGKLRDSERRLAEVGAVAERDGRRALRLEAELERAAATAKLEQEGSAAKLAQQEAQSRRLRAKLSALAGQTEELRRSEARLRQADKDLRHLRDQIAKGDSRLAAQLESLRKTPSEMEVKGQEMTEAEARCEELGARLRDQESAGQALRLQLEQLRRRTDDLEKLEGAFGGSRAEALQLRAQLEEEKQWAGRAHAELEELQRRLGELESREAELERAESLLKDQLTQLKSLAVTLADDRRNAAERPKAEGDKREELTREPKDEQGKVSRVTEKLIDESKKLLRLKSETEAQAARVGEESDDLKGQLRRERERRRRLDADVRQMKAAAEEARETRQIKEPTLEREALGSRPARPEVVRGDPVKTEDRYEAPETKFRTAQERVHSLAETVEEMTRRSWQRAEAEEDKSRELQAHVRALKEKIQHLLAKEDQLCLLQDHHSRLQRRFREEEGRAESLAQEAARLGRELQVARRCGRAPRPGMADARLASTAAQTDAWLGGSARDFLREAVLEESRLMSELGRRAVKKPAVLERYPPAAAEPERRTPEGSGALRIRVTPDPSDCSATVEIAGPRDFPTPGLRRPRITIVPRAAAAAAECRADEPLRSPVTITTVCRAASPDQSDGRPAPPSVVTVGTWPAAPAELAPRPPLGTGGRAVVTAEDKKIHIRLTAAADKRDADGGRPASGGNMSSSLTITPVVTAATCGLATSAVRAWQQL